MAKQYVRACRLNWDVEYLHDLSTGNGFIITEPATFNLDEQKKSLYGTRSILYGSSYEDETAFIERHRCRCGAFKGRKFEGEICPYCGTKVEYKNINIKYTGWISLGNNYIINPYYYNILKNVIGKKALPEIVNKMTEVDINGNISQANASDYINSTNPYAGIGLIEFRKNFEEIMKYYKKKKKNKSESIDRIITESSSVFTSHIPIYSTFLRPQSSTTNTFYYNTIDRHVNPLFKLSENLKESLEIDRQMILERIQKRVNSLWDENFKLLNGKEGWIRGQILGGALNYTSRNVIVPDPSLKDNQVDLSYNTFLSLFKNEIIYYIMKIDDIPLFKAESLWKQAYKFNNRIYEIMQFMLEKEKKKILINRNPTLNYYSMVRMDIRNIKPHVDDFTLSIPLSIISGMNADFDGDILNIIALVGPVMEELFKKFSPIERMTINRDTGLVNDYMTLHKDQKINLYYFATVE